MICMSYLDEIVLFTRKVNEAMKFFTEAVQEIAKTLSDLFECLVEEKEKEKTSVSSPKQYRLLLKNINSVQTKSLYKQPYVQAPRHLTYQRRHYQS